MISKKIIGLLLTASLILSGCSAKTKTPVSSVVNTKKDAVVTSETTTETTQQTTAIT